MESKEILEALGKLTRLTQENTTNIKHLASAVDKLMAIAEKQVVHEVKLEAFENDKKEIYSKIDVLEVRINKLLTKVEKELVALEGKQGSTIQGYRIKTLWLLLTAAVGIIGSLAVYIIKH